MRVVVYGGGAALAQPVIRHFLQTDTVVALCHRKGPDRGDPNLKVADMSAGTMADLIPANVLVTFTGAASSARLREIGVEAWWASLEANLTSVYRALHSIKVKPGGNVVVVGSIQGATGGYGCADYAAAKAGLVGLVRSAAKEWAKDDVCINLLELGYINAGMGKALPNSAKDRALKEIPLGRFGTEEDVVRAVDFLARTRYMTGNVLTLAGGMR